MQEIWKNVVGYKNLYQISNKGNVRSLDKIDSIGRYVKGKLMIPVVRKDGYLEVTLHKNGKGKHFLIHRLVAEAFIKNYNDCKEINHKDENKTNNNVDNLEWCNRSYNVNYGKANYNRRIALLNKRGKKLIQYSKSKKILQIYPSLMEACRQTMLSKSHISQCCNGYRKTAGGYIWEYA